MTEYPSTFTGIGGGENWDQSYAGAGVVDGVAQVVKSIEGSDGWSAGFNSASAVIDLLGFVENPVKSLGVTAIGWLIEHISFLDSFLDHTTGDPQAVQNAAETFFQAAEDLDGIAANQIRAFGMEVSTYRQGASPSAQEFESQVGPRGGELKALSLQCVGLGSAMNKAGVLVATTRGIIRDLLTEFTWWLIKKGTIALAAAPYTGGGSLAALLTDTCITGAKLAKTCAEKLSDLANKLREWTNLVRQLARAFGSSATRTITTSVGRNFSTAGAKAADEQITPSAANDAEQQVAEHEAKAKPRQELPFPQPQGPGLGARWTTSGTLDDS